MALFGGRFGRRFQGPQLGGAGTLGAGQMPPPMMGNGLKADEGKPQGIEPMAGTGGPVTSRRAFFNGAFTGKGLPRTLQVIGAGLQDINGSGHLAAFQENEAEQMRAQTEDMARGQAQKRQDEQRAQLEQAIASLPPEQQAWARLNPEAFAAAMMRAQVNGGWESGQGYSHLWRPNQDGTVTLGDPLPLRPRQGVQYNTPDGDDWEEY